MLGLVDSSGTLVERYEYTAYGQRQVFYSPGSNDPGCYGATPMSRRVVTSGSVIQPYGINDIGHQGLLHDEQTALVYNRARMLSPALGRFMQNDPLGYIGSMNVTLYESARPINGLDPTGLIDRYGPQYVYEIYYLSDGATLKWGITSGPLPQDGSLPRCTLQVNERNVGFGRPVVGGRQVASILPGFDARKVATSIELLRKAEFVEASGGAEPIMMKKPKVNEVNIARAKSTLKLGGLTIVGGAVLNVLTMASTACAEEPPTDYTHYLGQCGECFQVAEYYQRRTKINWINLAAGPQGRCLMKQITGDDQPITEDVWEPGYGGLLNSRKSLGRMTRARCLEVARSSHIEISPGKELILRAHFEPDSN